MKKNKSNQSREELYSAPGLQNLVKLESSINRFAPALMTQFQNITKVWDGRHHLYIENKKGKKFFARCSNHYNLNNIVKDKDIQKKNIKYWILFNENHCKIITDIEEHHIVLEDDHFLLDGITKQYSLDPSQITRNLQGEIVRDNLTVFKLTSLVKIATKNCNHSAGGKAKAIKQTGYQKVRMMFQHKNGEAPTEEVKSVIDAYKICSKYLVCRGDNTNGKQGMTIKGFRKAISNAKGKEYDGYSVDCGSYIIYLSFEGNCSSLYNNNNNIYNDNLEINRELGIIIEEGTGVPLDGKPSKDNNKKEPKPRGLGAKRIKDEQNLQKVIVSLSDNITKQLEAA